ncbi:hypothetical protein FRC14_004349 [Serendipita sp. 396]|nr:hypothetical protein FRC14_004349 [Serendipita sp. 396]
MSRPTRGLHFGRVGGETSCNQRPTTGWIDPTTNPKLKKKTKVKFKRRRIKVVAVVRLFLSPSLRYGRTNARFGDSMQLINRKIKRQEIRRRNNNNLLLYIIISLLFSHTFRPCVSAAYLFRPLSFSLSRSPTRLDKVFWFARLLSFEYLISIIERPTPPSPFMFSIPLGIFPYGLARRRLWLSRLVSWALDHRETRGRS